MKTLKITASDKIMTVDVDFEDYKSIQEAVGGSFELVQRDKLFDYFKMPIGLACDEEGLLKELPMNFIASYLAGGYNFLAKEDIICGDVVLFIPMGEDMAGLGEADSAHWKNRLMREFKNIAEDGDLHDKER